MPINSQLGDPKWEEKAKDGRFDRVKRQGTKTSRRSVLVMAGLDPAIYENPGSKRSNH